MRRRGMVTIGNITHKQVELLRRFKLKGNYED